MTFNSSNITLASSFKFSHYDNLIINKIQGDLAMENDDYQDYSNYAKWWFQHKKLGTVIPLPYDQEFVEEFFDKYYKILSSSPSNTAIANIIKSYFKIEPLNNSGNDLLVLALSKINNNDDFQSLLKDIFPEYKISENEIISKNDVISIVIEYIKNLGWVDRYNGYFVLMTQKGKSIKETHNKGKV
jgi:hypothetical protein